MYIYKVESRISIMKNALAKVLKQVRERAAYFSLEKATKAVSKR